MKPQWRTKMWPEKSYLSLDPGIRFAVRVLHADDIDTCQSCQGGKGHSYPEPSIDMVAGSDDAEGFAAVAALQRYGLPIRSVSLVWEISHSGTPYEKLWRITFVRTMEARANEKPSPIRGYRFLP